MLKRQQRVGKYLVEELLGQGGMAVVYRVRHVELRSEYALKLLTTPRTDIRERLLREGRSQAGVHHANVVAVHDVLELAEGTGLLMECVDGPTLDRWLQLYQPTFEEAESLFRGIVEGVAEAHRRGVVHRDLKPSNVLLATTAVGFVPKVCDFGIAKVMDEGDDPRGSTRPNVAMGTPYYMAPEQIRDARSVDGRADIFSLGCILFELVSGGERSFAGSDVLAVLNAVVEGKRLDPREFVPTLDDRICDVIDGCLQVDRERRFQSCAEVLTALGDQRGRGAVRRGLERSPEDWAPPTLHDERERWAKQLYTATPGGTPPRSMSVNEEVTMPGVVHGDEQPTAQHPILSPDSQVWGPPPPPVRRRTSTSTPAPLIDSDARTQPPVPRRGNIAEQPTAERSNLAPPSTPQIVAAIVAGAGFGLVLLFALLRALGYHPAH